MPRPLDDESLIRAASQGDEQAFQRLMDHYQGYVFGLCSRVCRNRADAEEAAQECFVSFYQHLHRWRPGAKLSNWLYTIALNKCRHLLRRRKLRRMLSLDFSPEGQAPIQPADTTWSPAERAEQSQLRGQLALAASNLPAVSRELFVLRYDLDLEMDEIAAITGRRPEAVRVGLHRARTQLRGLLKAQGLDVTAWGLGDREEKEA
jgi:RNA polymerase sigma-70 factor (ECF subfamily)